jgi:FkbM family methyltransferase
MIRKYFYTHYPRQYGLFMEIRSIVFLPIKLFFFKLGLNIYFGGKEQDSWVANEIFNQKKKGYFIDLASTNGVLENNTFYLEKRLNWKGICIEPNEIFFKQLTRNRKCICIKTVVSEKCEVVNFFENGGIGGIIGKSYDNNFKKRAKIIKSKKNIFKIKKYNSTTLPLILKKYSSPKIIDYLSLDCEGAEYQVLKNFPFNKYKFLSLTVERPNKELNKLLFQNGYIFVKNNKADTFYVHKNLQKKINLKIEKFKQIGKKNW